MPECILLGTKSGKIIIWVCLDPKIFKIYSCKNVIYLHALFVYFGFLRTF